MDIKQWLEKLIWNPSALTKYQGLYPLKDIEKARASLIQNIRNPTCLQPQVRKRLGIMLNSAEVKNLDTSIVPPSYIRDPNQGTYSFFDYIPTAGNHFQPFHSTTPVRHGNEDLPHLPNRSCLACLRQYAASQFPCRLEGTISVIKCDMCDYCQIHRDDTMKQHLILNSHRSASEYKAFSKGSTLEIEFRAVGEKFIYENKNAIDDKLFIVCPICDELFGDIFSCGYHCKIDHGDVHGAYNVSSLLASEDLNLLDFKTCKKCDTTFQKLHEINEHYQNNPDHLPLKYDPLKYRILYKCMAAFTFCNRKFRSLYQCLSHLYNNHCCIINNSPSKKNTGSEDDGSEEDASQENFSVQFSVNYIDLGRLYKILPSIDLEGGEKDSERMVKNILAYKKPIQSREGHKRLKRRLSGRQN